MRNERIYASQIASPGNIYNQSVGARLAPAGKVIYTNNFHPGLRPKIQRQTLIWQQLTLPDPFVSTRYSFFNTTPANIPIDGEGYRTPYINKNMRIIGIGLSIRPTQLTALSGANVRLLNQFSNGATQIQIGNTVAGTFQNSVIGPKFLIDNDTTAVGQYLVSFENKPTLLFKELPSGLVDSMTVTDKQAVSVVVQFSVAWGLPAAADNDQVSLICSLLTIPLEEQYLG